MSTTGNSSSISAARTTTYRLAIWAVHRARAASLLATTEWEMDID
jgi:hypothetical protein